VETKKKEISGLFSNRFESKHQVQARLLGTGDAFDMEKVLGEYSWVSNPENEKVLLEALEKYPLYDILN